MPPKLKHLLDLNPEKKHFLMDENQKEIEADAAFFSTYIRKKSRFSVLRDILTDIHPERCGKDT